MNLSHCRAVIVVIVMADCPYCEEYKPRLEKEVERWRKHGAPIVFGEKGQAFAAGQIPILLIDAESTDPQIQWLMDDFHVDGLPTTILFTRNAMPQKQEGALSEQEIYQMLTIAARA